jgi:hypothetical protein
MASASFPFHSATHSPLIPVRFLLL